MGTNDTLGLVQKKKERPRVTKVDVSLLNLDLQEVLERVESLRS